MPFQPNPASRVCVLGRTGSGKTVLSKTLMRAYNRVVILDRVQDYSPSDFPAHYFSSFDAFGKWAITAQNQSHWRVVFQFDIHDRDYLAIAEEIFALVYDMGSCLVVVDECQFYENSHYLTQLVLVGRRRNIAVLTATQRPANMRKDFISQSSDLFVGTLFETNDLKYLADILPASDIDRLAAIQPRIFLHYRPGQPSELIRNQ